MNRENSAACEGRAMTEPEWLTCTEPGPLLGHLGMRASERKLRLLGASCAQRVWHLLEAESLRAAVEALERFADGLMAEDAFRTAMSQVHPLVAYRKKFVSDTLPDEV